MRKSILLLFLCSLAWWPGRAQETVRLSLNDAVNYAWQNSNEMKNAQINIIDAEERIIENRAIGIPKLNGTVDYQRYLQVPVQVLPEPFVDLISALNPGQEVNREASFFLKNNFSAGLNLDALLFDGTYLTALKASKVYRDYTAREYDVTKREVRNQVIDAYLPVLLLEENLEILNKNRENLSQLFRETKALYDEGFAEQLDVDRLELSLANLEVEKENLERQQEAALNALKFTLNADQDLAFVIEEDLEGLATEVPQELLTSSINYQARPEVQYLEKGIDLADLNIEQYKMGYYPTLRSFISYTQTRQWNTQEDAFWAPTALVGVTLNVPIFDGWDKKAKIERAKLSREINLNQQNTLLQSIELEVTNARSAYTTAQKSLEAQERNLKLAERIYNTTQIKYREGVGSSLEVNQAEQSLYTAQGNYIQALYNLAVAKYDLLTAQGQ
ncbi:MAG TPA: TolC family protein [Saprospiraceae bacterium]|nr:TolC family protein [Saprospiraceae bacterium]